jgi:hypothetical protein
MKKIHTNTYKKRFGKRLVATAALSAVMFQNVFATSFVQTPPSGTSAYFEVSFSSPTAGDQINFQIPEC